MLELLLIYPPGSSHILLKMINPFPKVGYVSALEGTYCKYIHIYILVFPFNVYF